MASEPGGRADKLGNEFEKLWAVRHLIELVAGKALTVRIECLGDDEKGTEFWVTRPDRTREAHQCKRENASAGRWSVAELEAKGVISSAKCQLDRDPTNRFVFVSSDKAPQLATLCERAARSENASEFRQHSVTTTPELLREFRGLCSYLNLDPDRLSDVEKALDFLRRFRPLGEDKLNLRGNVEDLASAWLTGDPAFAVTVLKDLADKRLGLTIRAGDVMAALLPAGTRPRDLSQDPALHSGLEAVRKRFDRSYRHLLIRDRILERRETDELWQAITAESEPGIVLLHGPGGEGKSGVVFELVERLRDRGVPYLPLRLDRDRPGDSPVQFGRQLDLPASPAACLAAASDGERGVLILDQVDAIRWTSAHSAHAWDTCERVITEAARHPNVAVVVVCRSFDVEDDPRIRAWKNASKASEIKVGPLDDERVDRIVSECGVNPSMLGLEQRQVLRNPQGLYLWTLLHGPHSPPFGFRSIVDLMREFWRRTRLTLRELRPGPYDDVLEALVEHLDRRGTIAAPETVVARWVSEVNALISMNILAADRGKVLFVHQSYLDYLAAERVLREVLADSGTVLGWLERNDQSLFRRGQLRQLLALLRDDDRETYEKSLRALLTSEAVRFHLKHLALQIVGQADPPMPGEIDVAISLLDDETWRDHICDLVFTGRSAWVEALHARGILSVWLEADDENLVNRALYLLGRVTESSGAITEALLLDQRRKRRKEKLERVLWMSAPQRLSPRLFDAYVRLTRGGSPALSRMIRWKSLAAANPSRCIELLEARLRSKARTAHAASGDEPIRWNETVGLGLQDLAQVAAAAAKIPAEAWDKLVPLLVGVARRVAASRRVGPSVRFTSSRYAAERRLRRIILVLTRILAAAGSAFAATDITAFRERAERLSRVPSASVRGLLARCFAAGPDGEADRSLRWLLAKRSRLHCGGTRSGVYRPAYRLLRRYSRVCSDGVFSEVVSAILAYRPQAERDTFLRRHERLIESLQAPAGETEGDVLRYNVVGLGQYLLLSALPAHRLAGEAKSRFAVLGRKFGPAGPLLKGSPRSIGGRVTSTIPEDRLPQLSDRDWLRIVTGRWQGRARRWRQIGRDRIGEATVETFAAELGSVTKLQPRRFGRFALALPESADPRYVTAILRNVADTQPPNDHKKPETWQPASVEDIEAAAGHFGRLTDDREFATALCWAIVRRSGEVWSARTYEWLARIAMTHPHPREGEYTVFTGGRPDRPSEPDLLGTSINCVRGVAAEAIQALLFARRETWDVFRPAIDALTRDPHPSVRIAAIGLALPMLNIDRAAAVARFLAACSHETDEVLRSRHVHEFLRYTIWSHADKLGPLVDRMIRSRAEGVAQSGAAWVGAVWAHRGIWGERLETCLRGSPRLREGTARGLAFAVADECPNAAATDKLRALFDDPDRDVRAAAAGFFGNDGAFEIGVTPSLAQRFAESAALDENMDDLLGGLENYAGDLKGYAEAAFAMVARLSGPLAAEARDHQTRRPSEAEMLAKVLLRLYEQAEHDRALRSRCLDAWDRLIAERIGLDALRLIDA